MVAPEEFEEIVFVSFMSDHDPSFIFLVTYNPFRMCSYIKALKIFNKSEQEEDWKSNAGEGYEKEVEEKTFSMVEDEAKDRLI